MIALWYGEEQYPIPQVFLKTTTLKTIYKSKSLETVKGIREIFKKKINDE